MMAHKGLAKLSEETGELQQVIGKMLAFGTGSHPDGTESLLTRFEEEAADVLAAIDLVSRLHDADEMAMSRRAKLKLDRFLAWHRDTANEKPAPTETT